jgi:hypothetical protein
MDRNLLGKIFVAADSGAKTLRGILETAASLEVEVEKADSKLKPGLRHRSAGRRGGYAEREDGSRKTIKIDSLYRR